MIICVSDYLFPISPQFKKIYDVMTCTLYEIFSGSHAFYCHLATAQRISVGPEEIFVSQEK
jgi:hypothetical protein